MTGKKPRESTKAFRLRQLKEVDEALAAEPELYVGEGIGSQNWDSYDPNKTKVGSPEEQEGLETNVESPKPIDDLEELSRKGVRVTNGDTERKCDTTVIGIGEGPIDLYDGVNPIAFVVRNIAEKTLAIEKGDDINPLEEGLIVEILAVGYELDGKPHNLVEEKCPGALSPPFKVIRHEGGYWWAEPVESGPATPNNLGDLLKDHPKCRGLTEDERNRTKIYVQLLRYSEEEYAKHLGLIKHGTGTPPSRPEDTQGKLHKTYQSAAETRIEEFFGAECQTTLDPSKAIAKTEGDERKKRTRRLTEMFPFDSGR